MGNDQYLVKAEINRIAADQSVTNGYYHVAIGRHYYHFFLLAKFQLQNSWNISDERFKSRTKSTHIQFRSLLREILNDESWIGKVTNDEINDLLIYLEDLCDLRSKAEYTTYEYNENRYHSTCSGIVKKLDKMFKKFNFKESV